jgi:hypothetical protein
MILAIADALRTANIDRNSRDHVRRLLLARTAQVLDAINYKNLTRDTSTDGD